MAYLKFFMTSEICSKNTEYLFFSFKPVAVGIFFSFPIFIVFFFLTSQLGFLTKHQVFFFASYRYNETIVMNN